MDLALVLNSVSNSNHLIEILKTSPDWAMFFIVITAQGKLLSPTTKNPVFFMEFSLTTDTFGIIVIALSV